MRKLAATTSWGLALSVVLVLPGAGLSQVPIGKPVPAPAGYTPVWSADFSASVPLFVAASPAVVVTAGPSVPTIARRPSDGDTLWSVPDGAVSVPPAIADDLVILVNGRSVTARDATSGAPVWSASLSAAARHATAWTTGALVFATEDGIEAFRTNGTPVWQRDLPGIVTQPVVGAGVIVVGLEPAAVVTLTLADGTERWRHALPAAPGPVTLLQESLLVGTSDARWVTYALDGQRRWMYGPRVGTIGPATADDRHLYLAMLDNTVQAFDRQSGNRRWVADVDVRPMDGPVRIGDDLLVVGGTGDVVAVPIHAAGHTARRVFTVGTDLTGAAFEGVAVDSGVMYLLVSGQEAPGFRLYALTPGAAARSR